MQSLIGELQERIDLVSDLVSNERDLLNVAWPIAIESWRLPEDSLAVLDRYFQQFGSFGDAVVAAATDLKESLWDEAQTIAQKLQDLSAGEQASGDLSFWKKVALGVLVGGALLLIPGVAVGAAVWGAVTVGEAVVGAILAEAGAAITVAAAVLFAPEPPALSTAPA